MLLTEKDAIAKLDYSLAEIGAVAFEGYKSTILDLDLEFSELSKSDQIRFANAAQATVEWTLAKVATEVS